MIELTGNFRIQRLFCDIDKDVKISDIFRSVYMAGVVEEDISPMIPFFYNVEYGYTAIHDLSKPMDEIFSNMKSTVRNEIRRAEKEGFQVQNGLWYDELIEYYNRFAKSKGLNDRLSRERLTRYPEIFISKAIDNGNILAMHATIVDRQSQQSMLLFSCSQRFDDGIDKAKIGWANSYLHYKDFIYLQSIGILTYDWAGIAYNPENPQHSIGQFKMKFGGKLTRTIVLTTPLFRLLYKIKSVVYRMRNYIG